MIHVPHILHSYIPYTSDIYTVFVSRLLLKILIEPSRKPSFYFDPTLIWVTPCTEKKTTHLPCGWGSGALRRRTPSTSLFPLPPQFFFFFCYFPLPRFPRSPEAAPRGADFALLALAPLSPPPKPSGERGAEAPTAPDGSRRCTETLPALLANDRRLKSH